MGLKEKRRDAANPNPPSYICCTKPPPGGFSSPTLLRRSLMSGIIELLSSYTTQESQVSCIPPLFRSGYDRSAADLAFFVSVSDNPQSGLANGPKWAALKKHCLPHPANQKRPALAGGWAGCHNRLTANGPSMGDPGRYGRTGGTHHPLKSLGLDSSSLVSVGSQ